MANNNDPNVFHWMGLGIGIFNITLAVIFFIYKVGTPLVVLSFVVGAACGVMSLYYLTKNHDHENTTPRSPEGE